MFFESNAVPAGYRLGRGAYNVVVGCFCLSVAFLVLDCASGGLSNLFVADNKSHLPDNERADYCGNSFQEKLSSVGVDLVAPVLLFACFYYFVKKESAKPSRHDGGSQNSSFCESQDGVGSDAISHLMVADSDSDSDSDLDAEGDTERCCC